MARVLAVVWCLLDLHGCLLSPLKWSDLKYVFGIKEDRYAEEAIHA